MSPEPAPATTESRHADGSLPFLLLPGDGLVLISTDLKLLCVDRIASQSLGMAPDAPLGPLLVAMGCELDPIP